ncbi:MAG: 2-dehydro-3-deoxy-6-phosphogalactonate aldolase [Rhodobacteraceae bacterium]|nr:2-dehydro-3-deoxy-6-phosphogalactonate aldolase [Paracoccaceae bacterium]
MPRDIIAILRGVEPADIGSVCEVLIECGIGIIEVPLNSPDPFKSIEIMATRFGQHTLIGAGTVLNIDDVQRIADVGGQMIVSPNCNPDVISFTKAKGLRSYPGVFTPTECFAALDAGADGLKIFPSFCIGPEGIKAFKAVLPTDVKIYAVGGVGPDNFATWLKAGVTGFGIGSGLYTPILSLDDIQKRANTLVAAYDRDIAALS